MRRIAQLVVCAGLIAVAGDCKLQGNCDQSGVPGIQIAVRDFDTGAAAADSAVGILHEFTYSDTMFVNQFEGGRGLVLAGAVDRPGTYNLCLHKAGYADYMKNDILVAESSCGIAPQSFLVYLRVHTDTSTVC